MTTEKQPEENSMSDALDVAVVELCGELRKKNRHIWMQYLAITTLTILAVLQFQYLPPERVVSMDTQGRIFPLPTLDNPLVPQNQWLRWTEEKAEALFDIPFTELATFQNKLTFMTKESRDNWVNALRQAGYLKKIEQERSILRAVRLNRAALYNEWLISKDNRLVRQYVVPMQLIFESPKGKDYYEVILTINVAREHLALSEEGWVMGTVDVKPGRTK